MPGDIVVAFVNWFPFPLQLPHAAALGHGGGDGPGTIWYGQLKIQLEILCDALSDII